VWDAAGEKIILLEAWIVVECVAPARLHVERFLPQTPLRILVDHKGGDHTEEIAFAKPPLRKGDPASLMRNEAVKRKFLPAMLEKTRALGTAKSHAVIGGALTLMQAEMAAEITRLRSLSEVNDHIKPEEITALEARESELAAVIQNARVRLDAVRLIWKAPPH
jgi:ATP-dependent helicase HepA